MSLIKDLSSGKSSISVFQIFVTGVLLVMISLDVFAEKPGKVLALAGQSNMDGQADIRTLDFLGEDEDPSRMSLLLVKHLRRPC